MASTILAPVHTKLLKSWTGLARSAIAFSHTGDTIETIAATYTLLGSTMGPNGVLKVTTLWSFNVSSTFKTGRVWLGGLAGTSFFAFNFADSNNDNPANVTGQAVTQIRNRNSESSQVGPGAGNFGARTSGTLVTASINTAVAQDVVFTVKCGVATDTIALEAWMIEVLYGA